MSVQYCIVDDVKTLGSMPSADIDELEVGEPGITDKLCIAYTAFVNDRLRKRYAVPFAAPYPVSVQICVARMVAWRLWIRRGVNPSGEISSLLSKDAESAEAWLKEAADAETGFIDLPRVQDTDASGVSKGGPFSYSEASPYAWTDIQRERGRALDNG